MLSVAVLSVVTLSVVTLLIVTLSVAVLAVVPLSLATFGWPEGTVMSVAGVLAVFAAPAVLPTHVFGLAQLARVGPALVRPLGVVLSTCAAGRPVRVGLVRAGLARVGLVLVGLLLVGLVRAGLARVGLVLVGLLSVDLGRVGLLSAGVLSPCPLVPGVRPTAVPALL